MLKVVAQLLTVVYCAESATTSGHVVAIGLPEDWSVYFFQWTVKGAVLVEPETDARSVNVAAEVVVFS